MFTELATTLFVFVLLVACAWVGRYIRPRLSDAHRARETVEIMHTMISLLVTLAALVLGLLTASVRTAYDNAEHDRQQYALQLTGLDQCLRDYGPDADGARNLVASYTAGVIASTWPSEPRPTNIDFPNTTRMARTGANPDLASLMHQIGERIRRLDPTDAYKINTIQDCRVDYNLVLKARLSVIADVRAPISPPFFEVFVFWLMIIFGFFGLLAPRNGLSSIAIMLCALSLSSAVLVIIDLSHPYGGFFAIRSEDMREALAQMMTQTP